MKMSRHFFYSQPLSALDKLTPPHLERGEGLFFAPVRLAAYLGRRLRGLPLEQPASTTTKEKAGAVAVQHFSPCGFETN